MVDNQIIDFQTQTVIRIENNKCTLGGANTKVMFYKKTGINKYKNETLCKNL